MILMNYSRFRTAQGYRGVPFGLFILLLATQEFYFLYSTWLSISNSIRFGFQSDNSAFVEPRNVSFSITSCPHLTPSMPQWRNLSIYQQKIFRAIAKSHYFKPNCSTDAQVAAISYDAISRDQLDTTNFNAHIIEQLTFMPKAYSTFRKLLVFNLFAGTWPSYVDKLDFEVSRAIFAKASLNRSSSGREDISLPLFLPNYRFRGRFKSKIRNTASKYLLTFKGKRYLNGAGVSPRQYLYKIHNPEAGILMLTSCKHGKDWERLDDGRCLADNKLYDQYDYWDLMANSTFCLIPKGRRLGTYRFLETLEYGCIPVVLADGWGLPLHETIDWSKAAVIVSEDQLLRIPEILQNISLSKRTEMRHQVSVLFEAYFSSIEQIIHSALEILANRHRKKTGAIWNRYPGALFIDTANYSSNLLDFPFYHRHVLNVGLSSKKSYSLILRVNIRHDCHAKIGQLVDQNKAKLSENFDSHAIVVENHCRMFEKSNPPPLFDANFYLRQTSLNRPKLNRPGVILVDSKITFISDFLLSNFAAQPAKISALSTKFYRYSGALLQDSVSQRATNCSGLVELPDYGSGAVILHRYYLHLYVSMVAKGIRDQARRIGNCEYLLLTALTGHVSLENRPFTAVTKANATQISGTISCSCYKLILDQFGWMPLS